MKFNHTTYKCEFDNGSNMVIHLLQKYDFSKLMPPTLGIYSQISSGIDHIGGVPREEYGTRMRTIIYY